MNRSTCIFLFIYSGKLRFKKIKNKKNKHYKKY